MSAGVSAGVSAGSCLVDELLGFDGYGKATVAETVGGIPYLINAFWTAGQRQAHSLHEISYRACFKAQLPEFFIARLTRPGDVVFDPFMGRVRRRCRRR